MPHCWGGARLGTIGGMPTTTPTPRWKRIAEGLFYTGVIGVLLYRFVLPVPSAPLRPEAMAVQVTTDGQPRMVEFSADR